MIGFEAVLITKAEKERGERGRKLNDTIFAGVEELNRKNTTIDREWVDAMTEKCCEILPGHKQHIIRQHIVDTILAKYDTLPWGIMNGKELPKHEG